MNTKKTDLIYLNAVLCAMLLLVLANIELKKILRIIVYISIYAVCILVSHIIHNASAAELKKAFALPSHITLLCSTVYTAITVINIFASCLFPMHSMNIEFSLYTAIFSGIVVPVFEEIFWRGCLCRSFIPFGTIPALIIPSVLFGLLHNGTAGLITATFAGIMFSYLYILTGSLIPSIIIHILNNTAGVLSVEYPIIALIIILSTIVVFISSNIYYKIKNTQKPRLKLSCESTVFKSLYIYLCLLIFTILRIAGGLR
ncbi:MAG: CPBP family intramembrane metalloprotease [Ruminococcaceae bacterium]|nr:CPBP family intramembrane metalloprotease [Oscillospiraceae bacterium]